MPSIKRRRPAKPTRLTPKIPPPPQGYMFVTELKELEEVRRKAEDKHRIWHSPPVLLGETLVFRMEKPVDWDDLHPNDKMRLKREHLVRNCGSHNVWFEEDERPRHEELMYAFRLNYFALFEVEDGPNVKQQLADTQCLIEWLRKYRRASLDDPTIAVSNDLISALLQQENTYCDYERKSESQRAHSKLIESATLPTPTTREQHLLKKYRDWMQENQRLSEHNPRQHTQEQELQRRMTEQSQSHYHAVERQRVHEPDKAAVLQKKHIEKIQRDALLHCGTQTGRVLDEHKFADGNLGSHLASLLGLSKMPTPPMQRISDPRDIQLENGVSLNTFGSRPHQPTSLKRSAPSMSAQEQPDPVRPAKKRCARVPKQIGAELGTTRYNAVRSGLEGVPAPVHRLDSFAWKYMTQLDYSRVRMTPDNALIFARPTTLLQISFGRTICSVLATTRKPPLKFIRTQQRDPIAYARFLATRSSLSGRRRLCSEYGTTMISRTMKKHYQNMTEKFVSLMRLKMHCDLAIDSAYKIDEIAIEKAIDNLAVMFQLFGWKAARYGTVAEAVEAFLQLNFKQLLSFKEEPDYRVDFRNERSYNALLSSCDEAMWKQSLILDEANKRLAERHLTTITRYPS